MRASIYAICLLIASVLFIAGCEKQNNPKRPAKPMHAGVSSEPGIRYHDFKPDQFIAPVMSYLNGVAVGANPGALNIDLDKNYVIDFVVQPVDPSSSGVTFVAGQSYGVFYSSDLTIDSVAVSSNNPNIPPQPTRQCLISIRREGLSFASEVLYQNDIIDYHLHWQSPAYNQYPKTITLSSYLPPSNGQPAIEDNKWNGPGKYLAIRSITGNDTLYGWVGIQIENFDSVIVRDYGFMR
jgi:hypothetical protein